jgi:hypothetical protein
VGICAMSVEFVLRYMLAENACAIGLSTHGTLIALRRYVALGRRLGVSLRLAWYLSGTRPTSLRCKVHVTAKVDYPSDARTAAV